MGIMTYYYLSSPAEDSFDMTVPSASKLLLMYPLSFSLVPVTEATISLALTALSSEKKNTQTTNTYYFSSISHPFIHA